MSLERINQRPKIDLQKVLLEQRSWWLFEKRSWWLHSWENPIWIPYGLKNNVSVICTLIWITCRGKEHPILYFLASIVDSLCNTWKGKENPILYFLASIVDSCCNYLGGNENHILYFLVSFYVDLKYLWWKRKSHSLLPGKYCWQL